MTIEKKTEYICIDCGNVCKYENLVRKLTYTLNNIETHFNHKCSVCNGRKFIIISTIIGKII